MPGRSVLPAGPASPAAAHARPQLPPPPRPRRTPRPRQGQVRRACREAAPPGVAELNCSGFGGLVSVPDRVRSTKLTYPIPPRISPRHAAPADAGRRAEPRGRPRGRVAAGPASGQIAGRRKYRRAPALQDVPSGLSHASPSTSAQPSRTVTRAAAPRRATRRNAWDQDIVASARPSRRRRCLTPASAGPPPLLVAGCHEQTSGGALSRRTTAVLGVTAAQHRVLRRTERFGGGPDGLLALLPGPGSRRVSAVFPGMRVPQSADA